MKVITIGRGEDCNILIEDPMISRRHAVIRVFDSGKIEIVDYSSNGTSVNGVRLAPEKLTRISRKDIVTFADTQTLDWSKIPNPGKPIKIAVGSAMSLVILFIVGFGVKVVLDSSNDEPTVTSVEEVTITTSTDEQPKDDNSNQTPGTKPGDVSSENNASGSTEGDAILEQQKKQQQKRESARTTKGRENSKSNAKNSEEPQDPPAEKEPESSSKSKIRG